MGNESSSQKNPAEMPHPYTVTSTSPSAGARSVSPTPNTNSAPTTPKDPRNNMIVVNRAKAGRKVDPILETLGKIPSFLPIIGTSVGSNIYRDMPTIDDKSLVCACNRFKEHMATSSKKVIQRQEEVGDRVRWVEKNASARANRLGKTTQLMQKAEDRIIDVTTLHNEVLKLNDRIHYMILPKLVALNQMLPADHQLESVLGIFQDFVPPKVTEADGETETVTEDKPSESEPAATASNSA
mmetsp:Transcript_90175/g.125299  ORF Transcript_90175/g.125299 Transcript_90175/m.125299 type:complete len:240 (-) Transcript_90175:28-747(-)